MTAFTRFTLLCTLFCFGCVTPKVGQDTDRDALVDGAFDAGAQPDGTLADASSGDGFAPHDAASSDAASSDAASSDAELDGGLGDAEIVGDGTIETDGFQRDEGVVDIDGGLVDEGVPVFDFAIFDASPPPGDSSEPAPDLGAPFEAIVEGVAVALAGGVVTVTAGELSVETDAQGRFRIGPVDSGRVTLSFSAEGHEFLRRGVDVDAEVTVLPEPVELFRGVRVGSRADGRILSRFDDSVILYEAEGELHGVPTDDPGSAWTLNDNGYEVFLGFSPVDRTFLYRRRVQPGIAGDIHQVPLEQGPRHRLFEQAQPWARWVGAQVIAMVQTAEALSILQYTTPGEPPVQLGQGVPWLMVSTLADDRAVWMEGPGPEFEMYVGALDGTPKQRISTPEGPSSEDFIVTTPGRNGVVWRTPDGDLWRWEPDAPARLVAEDTLQSPRPRFLSDGRMMFWRISDGGTQEGFVTDGDVESSFVDFARGSTLREIGGGFFYIVRPDTGLWLGNYDGEGGDVIEGLSIQFVTVAGGAIALADGAAFGHHPETGLRDYDLDGLSTLSNAGAGGVTVWQFEAQSLWYLPAPIVGGQPVELSSEAPAPSRILGVGNLSIYVLGAEGWGRRPMPPADGDVVLPVQPNVAALRTISATLLVGQTLDGELYAIDGQTAVGRQWAYGVTTWQPSSRRGFIFYACERGSYLVDLR